MDKPQIQHTMSENYNIFKVLKFERKETIHSAMIAAIIEHDKHNWTTFFDLLEEKGKEMGFNVGALRDPNSINFNDNTNHKWIDTEKVLEKLNKKEGDTDWGRADIWIGSNKGNDRYRLIIENKIDAGFQYRQLRGYYRYLIEEPRKIAGLFVLCVDDNQAFRDKADEAAFHYNHESMWTETNQVETHYAIITYTDIKEWLEKVVNNDTKDAKFNSIVKDYLSVVRGLIKEKEDVSKTIQEDYEYTVITVTDEDGYGWDYSIDHILDNALFGSKEHQLDYLSDIIHDIEHYRDYLNALDPSNERFKQWL